MRNILVVALLIFVGFGANAQITMTNSGDTITNTGTVNLDATIKGSQNVVGFQVVIAKLSGTVAGTVVLQASLDGTNYNTISTDTLTLTDVTTQSNLWTVSPNSYLNYRLKATGSGTMSATATGLALPRR